MLCETYKMSKYQIIKFNKALTLYSDITELADIVNDLLKKNFVNIAIHFKSNSYLCSGSAAVIVRCWEYIKDKNGNIVMINVNLDILDFLAIIDLDSVIKTFSSEEELKISGC